MDASQESQELLLAREDGASTFVCVFFSPFYVSPVVCFPCFFVLWFFGFSFFLEMGLTKGKTWRHMEQISDIFVGRGRRRSMGFRFRTYVLLHHCYFKDYCFVVFLVLCWRDVQNRFFLGLSSAILGTIS